MPEDTKGSVLWRQSSKSELKNVSTTLFVEWNLVKLRESHLPVRNTE